MTESGVPPDAGRLLRLAAALLILLGLLTGGLVAMAMTGAVDADPGSAVAAHLNALLGGFWLLGIAWSLPHVSYGPAGQRRLAYLAIVSNYANWLVTAVKAPLRVHGVGMTGDTANDAVFLALTLAVVIPSLAAATAWLWGLYRGPQR